MGKGSVWQSQLGVSDDPRGLCSFPGSPWHVTGALCASKSSLASLRELGPTSASLSPPKDQQCGVVGTAPDLSSIPVSASELLRDLAKSLHLAPVSMGCIYSAHFEGAR